MASGSSSATDFGFFRIIFKETLETETLVLPNKFGRLYGETLSGSVFFSLPDGLKWKIGLGKRDNKFWLRQGWLDFVRHYALGFGHLLYFRYKGDSKFQLSICDLSTCEINYPSIRSHLDEPDVRGSKKGETEVDKDTFQTFESSDDDDSVHIFDSIEDEEEPLQPSSPPHKRMRTGGSSQSMETATGDKSTTERERKPRIPINMQSETPTQVVKNVRRDRRCISRNPCFAVIMEQSVIDRNELFLPFEFWQKHLDSKSGDVILRVSGGSTWPVKICFKKCGRQGPYLQKAGWEKFARDNNLAIGDSCTFQLVNGNNILFDVSISRVTDQLHSQSPHAGKNSSTQVELKRYVGVQIKIECNSDSDFRIQPVDQAEEAKSKHPERKGNVGKGNRTALAAHTRRTYKDSEAFKAANKFFSRKPFFKSVVTRTYNMRLPDSFAKRHIEQKSQTVRLEVGAKSWPVQFLNCKTGKFLCGGYSKFLVDNSLGRGDVCIYELNDIDHRREVVLKVSIFRCKNQQE